MSLLLLRTMFNVPRAGMRRSGAPALRMVDWSEPPKEYTGAGELAIFVDWTAIVPSRCGPYSYGLWEVIQ